MLPLLFHFKRRVSGDELCLCCSAIVLPHHASHTALIFCRTTTPQNDHVILAEAPPDVKVVRCCFTDTERCAHQPRDLFSNACLDAEAAAGRWIGTYDVPLSCNGRVETPMFKLPHRSAQRIKDFVAQMLNRRYSSVAGMMGCECCISFGQNQNVKSLLCPRTTFSSSAKYLKLH